MAHVTFHSMRLNFRKLKTIMNNANFVRLVFQPILQDVDKSKDDYVLVCYEEYSNVQEPSLSDLELVVTNKKVFDAKKKVMFGNLHLNRSVIQSWITAAPNALFLDFLPTGFGDYVKYIVNTDPPTLALAAFELKPSPPAS